MLASSIPDQPGCTLSPRSPWNMGASTSPRRHIASLSPSLIRSAIVLRWAESTGPRGASSHVAALVANHRKSSRTAPHFKRFKNYRIGQFQVHRIEDWHVCKVGKQGFDARLSLNSIVNTYKLAVSFEKRPAKPPRCSTIEQATSRYRPLRCQHTITHKAPAPPHSPSTQENT
ncbi:hypothetical protein LY78DRAFT_123147 [Colletotrichum sublineola]|uniref:Uncharacterized protein n=1 Tax=Colletotrichum sublineola TaxID=1173701 RepID=A0A066XJF3_COLSU|nr:hypothetical protein LY78DRAFT_123147 [Colletotrichum sublineola]KDN67779.1 hypothetical protein CSUB01_05912 [Colletotrichum sublineola]